jgi:hypothetical protein
MLPNISTSASITEVSEANSPVSQMIFRLRSVTPRLFSAALAFSGIVGVVAGLGEAGEAGRDHAFGFADRIDQDVLDQGLAVDRPAECLADADVGQRVAGGLAEVVEDLVQPEA